MPTTRPNNRYLAIGLTIAAVSYVPLLVLALSRREWWTVLLLLVVAIGSAVPFLLRRRAPHSERLALWTGWRLDERQTLLVQRAWMVVGLAQYPLVGVLFAIDYARGASGPWPYLLVFNGVVFSIAMSVLRSDERSRPNEAVIREGAE